MEEIARVYASALFGAAKDKGKLDSIREQLGAFAGALAENREMQLFFFSPYFSSAEKEDGLRKAVSDAEPELLNFLLLLIEKHRMPVLYRIRKQFDAFWAKENKRLGVTVTSAVELDPEIAERIGKEIESVARQPEMKDDLQQIRWLGFALTEAVAFYTFIFGLIAFFL